MIYISSVYNPEVKHIVKLHESKTRKEYNQCIIEGLRAVSTAISGNLKLQKLFVTEDKLEKASALAGDRSIIVVSDGVMKKISTATTPSGILGIFETPKLIDFKSIEPGLVLAQISDPGNMGTLIRTAVACNVKNVIVVEGVDPWSSKVIQATAGSIAHVNIFELTWQELLEAKKNLKLCALVVNQGASINDIDPKQALLVVGNEAHGIPSEWQKTCDQLVTLKMPGKTESLNAAVAGSIALYLTYCK